MSKVALMGGIARGRKYAASYQDQSSRYLTKQGARRISDNGSMRHTSPRHSEASHPACYRDSPSGGAGGMREPHVRPNNENKSKPYSTMHEGTTTHKGSTVHEDSALHDDSIDCIMFELTCSRRIPLSDFKRQLEVLSMHAASGPAFYS